jgi:ABC-type sugar transport system permease subunit
MTEGVIVARAIAAPRRRRVVGRVAEQPIVWLLPLAVLLLVSYVYPAIDDVRFSFTNATLLNPEYEYTLQSYTNVSANRDLRASDRVQCGRISGDMMTGIPALRACSTIR